MCAFSVVGIKFLDARHEQTQHRYSLSTGQPPSGPRPPVNPETAAAKPPRSALSRLPRSRSRAAVTSLDALCAASKLHRDSWRRRDRMVAGRDVETGKGDILSGAGAVVTSQFSHVEWEGFCFFTILIISNVHSIHHRRVYSIVFSVGQQVGARGRTGALHIMRVLLPVHSAVRAWRALLRRHESRHWPDIRLVGVLQRIALCYLFASLLFLNRYALRGTLISAFVLLLGGYWALMTFTVPVPTASGAGSVRHGCATAGYNWIDFNYLPGMKWDATRDPEGLLSTPAGDRALACLACLPACVLRERRLEPQRKSLLLIGAGIVMVAAGYLWAVQFPIIKQIWTSSFVLVAGGCQRRAAGRVPSAHRRLGMAEVVHGVGVDR